MCSVWNHVIIILIAHNNLKGYKASFEAPSLFRSSVSAVIMYRCRFLRTGYLNQKRHTYATPMPVYNPEDPHTPGKFKI